MKLSELHQKALRRQAEVFPVSVFLSSEKTASFSSATMWRKIGQTIGQNVLNVLYLFLTNSALLNTPRPLCSWYLEIYKVVYIFAWMWTNQKLISFLCTFLSVPFYSQKKTSSFSRPRWMGVCIFSSWFSNRNSVLQTKLCPRVGRCLANWSSLDSGSLCDKTTFQLVVALEESCY